jgi:hypothetical protein
MVLSAIFAKPSTATAAPTPNPHSRQALTAFPRVRSSEAFRRRPLYRVDRSRRAGIRNPSRFRTLGRVEVPRTGSTTADVRRDEHIVRDVSIADEIHQGFVAVGSTPAVVQLEERRRGNPTPQRGVY